MSSAYIEKNVPRETVTPEADAQTELMMKLIDSFANMITGRRIRLAALKQETTDHETTSLSDAVRYRDKLGVFYEYHRVVMRCEQVHFQSVGAAQTDTGRLLPFRLLFYMPREYYLIHDVASRVSETMRVMPVALSPRSASPDGKSGSTVVSLPDSEGFHVMQVFDLDQRQWITDQEDGLTPIRLHAFSINGEMNLFTLGSTGVGGIELGRWAIPQWGEGIPPASGQGIG